VLKTYDYKMKDIIFAILKTGLESDYAQFSKKTVSIEDEVVISFWNHSQKVMSLPFSQNCLFSLLNKSLIPSSNELVVIIEQLAIMKLKTMWNYLLKMILLQPIVDLRIHLICRPSIKSPIVWPKKSWKVWGQIIVKVAVRLLFDRLITMLLHTL